MRLKCYSAIWQGNRNPHYYPRTACIYLDLGELQKFSDEAASTIPNTYPIHEDQ